MHFAHSIGFSRYRRIPLDRAAYVAEAARCATLARRAGDKEAIMIGLLMLAATAMSLDDLRVICGGNRPSDPCRLYVLGVAEGLSLGMGVLQDRSHFCLPENVSATEMVEVVKRQTAADLARFPEDKTLSASGFIGAALMGQYPCHR